MKKHGIQFEDTKRPFSLDLAASSRMFPTVTGHPHSPISHLPLMLHFKPLNPLALLDNLIVCALDYHNNSITLLNGTYFF
jgi:hypothetical protein